MDTTKENIEMCEKAEEIQKGWIPKTGDYYWLGKDHLQIPDACRILCEDPLRFERGKAVWLPHQDRLQEMIGRSDYVSLLKEFAIFYDGNDSYTMDAIVKTRKYRDTFHSMEQLWLAFVMKTKHNKVWSKDEKEWERDEQ